MLYDIEDEEERIELESEIVKCEKCVRTVLSMLTNLVYFPT